MENIARIELPKGLGLCTKTPLELKLRSRDQSRREDYATIRHKDMPEGEIREIAIDSVADEIRLISEEITKKANIDIVNVPIFLTIYRENQMDLTMIDLPGMTYMK